MHASDSFKRPRLKVIVRLQRHQGLDRIYSNHGRSVKSELKNKLKSLPNLTFFLSRWSFLLFS